MEVERKQQGKAPERPAARSSPTRNCCETVFLMEALLICMLPVACRVQQKASEQQHPNLMDCRDTTSEPCKGEQQPRYGFRQKPSLHTRPRMTLIADWLPALPPAPTSMVRNRVTTRWFLSRSWYRSSTMLEVLCSTSRPSSHLLRAQRGHRHLAMPPFLELTHNRG